MTITVSQITSLVGRYTNEIVTEQANLESAILGNGVLKRLKKPDKLGVVNIKAGELRSAGAIADGGTLPTGGDVQPVQGTYQPLGIFGRVSIPRMAAMLASTLDDGIDLVKEEMSSCGETLGRQLGRSIFGQAIGSPTATVNAASTTFTVSSPSAWRVGMAFEIWNGATAIEGTTEATQLYVTQVAIPADGVGDTTITFVGTNAGGNAVQWLTTYTFYLRGGKANAMTTLSDITAAASLYGQSNTTNEWSGTLDTTTTTLTVPALRPILTTVIRRRGRKPTHVLSSRKNEERYSNQLINNRRFMGGKMDAVGGADFEFEGIPWMTDENIDDTDVYFFNDKDVRLHEFRDFAPDFDGAAKKSMGLNAAVVSDTTLTYDIQVWGAFNVRAERRNGIARFSALTS